MSCGDVRTDSNRIGASRSLITDRRMPSLRCVHGRQAQQCVRGRQWMTGTTGHRSLPSFFVPFVTAGDRVQIDLTVGGGVARPSGGSLWWSRSRLAHRVVDARGSRARLAVHWRTLQTCGCPTGQSRGNAAVTVAPRSSTRAYLSECRVYVATVWDAAAPCPRDQVQRRRIRGRARGRTIRGAAPRFEVRADPPACATASRR